MVGVPILGPYLVTESTDILCLGFICEGLDSGGRHQQVPLAGGFLAEGGVPFSSAASWPGKEHQWLNSQFLWVIQFLIWGPSSTFFWTRLLLAVHLYCWYAFRPCRLSISSLVHLSEHRYGWSDNLVNISLLSLSIHWVLLDDVGQFPVELVAVPHICHMSYLSYLWRFSARCKFSRLNAKTFSFYLINLVFQMQCNTLCVNSHSVSNTGKCVLTSSFVQ